MSHKWPAELVLPPPAVGERLGALEGFDPFGGAEQQQVGRAGGKQTIGDHADDGVDLAFQLGRVGDRQVEHVEDDIAVVGYHSLTIHGVATELDQLAGHMAARHRDDFHRQREGPQ